MVSWDSVRADQLPMYGYERNTTPYLNEIAKEGLIFDDTHVAGVGTPTSFTGIFTGQHAHADQTLIDPEHWKQANENRVLLSKKLQEAGYHTGGVHANALMSTFYGWNRGWDTYEDNLWTQGDTDLTSPDENGKTWWLQFKKTTLLPALRKANLAGLSIHAKNVLFAQQAYSPWEELWEYVDKFVRKAPEPWFLWVLLIDTHHPWTAPKEFQEWEQPPFRRMNALNYIMRRAPEWTGFRNQKIVNAYDNELRHADAFMRSLDALLDETDNDDAPLIMHSDHGDELGEHGSYGHRPAMWDTVTRVPLIMKNVGETGRVEGPHSLKDLGSTVLDLAGSDYRLNNRPSLLGDERPERDSVYIENRKEDGTRLAATAGRDWRKVVYVPDGGFMAFDRDKDPYEQKDIWGQGMDEKLKKLETRLQERLRETDSGTVENSEGEMTAETQERLANLGYIE